MIDNEQRASTRNEVEVPLQFKVPATEELAVTRLLNFSQGGVCFESHLPLTPDNETTIVIPDLLSQSPTPEAYAGYRVQIRWCNELENRKLSYGIGAKLLEKTAEFTKAKSLEHHSTCDLCDRLIVEGSVCRIDGAGCLCLPCYKHLEGIPEGSARDIILKYIDRSII